MQGRHCRSGMAAPSLPLLRDDSSMARDHDNAKTRRARVDFIDEAAPTPDGVRPLIPLPAIEFDTPRLRLRAWCESDHAPFAAMNADHAVMEFFPAVQSRAASDASIAVWRAQFAALGWSNWAVERRDSGEFIGFVGLSIPRRIFAFSPCVEIGWRLARAQWGQGYASEAARAALRVGFERIGLDEIVSFTALNNRRSRAVMERIGLRDAQLAFEHPAVPPGNALRAHCLYRITRAQWRDDAR